MSKRQWPIAAALVFASVACGASPAADAKPDAGGEAAIDAAPDSAPLDEVTLAALRALSPDPLPPPPVDPTNAFGDRADAALLGQRLFFEPLFSGALLSPDDNGVHGSLGKVGDTGKVSCASCHVPSAAFSDDRSYHQEVSLGAEWGRRRAPALLDVAQARSFMWDGRKDTLYAQVFGPLESPAEMNASRLFAAEQIFALHRARYEAVFGPLPPLDDTRRFPAISAPQAGCQKVMAPPDRVPSCTSVIHGAPGDHAEYDSMTEADQIAVTRVWVNVGKAIAAYERLLSCGPTRFDRFMHGEATALTAGEQRGAALFVGKGRCVGCHSGAFFTDGGFHDVGLRPTLVIGEFIDGNDHGAAVGLAQVQADPLNSESIFSDVVGGDGRLPKSIPPSMEGAFKTPGLRCVGQRPSFMHTGGVATLEHVVDFFDRGGDSAGFLGVSELSPLRLTDQEKLDLVAFLRALDGPGPNAKLMAPPTD